MDSTLNTLLPEFYFKRRENWPHLLAAPLNCDHSWGTREARPARRLGPTRVGDWPCQLWSSDVSACFGRVGDAGDWRLSSHELVLELWKPHMGGSGLRWAEHCRLRINQYQTSKNQNIEKPRETADRAECSSLPAPKPPPCVLSSFRTAAVTSRGFAVREV